MSSLLRDQELKGKQRENAVCNLSMWQTQRQDEAETWKTGTRACGLCYRTYAPWMLGSVCEDEYSLNSFTLSELVFAFLAISFSVKISRDPHNARVLYQYIPTNLS